jgi:hypothetical protein
LATSSSIAEVALVGVGERHWDDRSGSDATGSRTDCQQKTTLFQHWSPYG